MSLMLEGYRVDHLVRQGSAGQVWAATRVSDGLGVIAKSFSIEGSAELEARVEHEFELIRSLDCPGVVRALALERSGRDLVLILEAYDGIDLHAYTKGRALSVDEFLDVAEQLASILADVHQRRVLHRDLKPTNVLIDPRTGKLALADFGISVLLESERGHIHDPSIIEGTLPYIAPEQTGRTSREIDFRTDLYSLGVTLYELLTGRLPFTAESPLALIHAHFARRPQPPQRLRPELPTRLSDLVMKLLEKAPERRYQSAQGLLEDLHLLREMLGRGPIDKAFELGSRDASTSLQLPHRLYGRDDERAQLRGLFHRAAAGSPALVVVSGPSGIGKSALLDEIVEPLIARRGLLARGKFDDESERPFAAIISAVTEVIDQLLTEPSEALERWKIQLGAALGDSAPALCAFVPRLRAVLSEVGPSVDLNPVEARTRVMAAFCQLLSVLARPEHPLVLALDDLQWIDSASVTLLDTLLANGEAALLVLATARDQAFEAGAGLQELLAKLAARELEPTLISLAPLTTDQVGEMLADMLSQPVEAVAPLARVVARKTGSNPFFARQFLLLLGELGLLERTPAGWSWDLQAIERASLPEDALEMMTAKISRLDDALQDLLCVASVFGTHFDPITVERVVGGASAMAGFQRLLDEGLLSPVVGQGLLFAHDRIREAAYALLGPERRRERHLAAGEAMLERVAGDSSPEPADLRRLDDHRQVFEIADHLDRGYGLLDPDTALEQFDLAQTELLATINLRAGQRALASGAPHAAQTYLNLAARLLDALEPFPDLRQPRRELHFDVQLSLGEAAALNLEVELADSLAGALLARPLSADERARLTVARIWQLAVSKRREQAMVLGLETLRHLGLDLPRKIRLVHVITALPGMARLAVRMEREGFDTREVITDPQTLAIIDVIMALNFVAYTVAPQAFVLLVQRHAQLIERRGDHPSAPLAITQVAVILANALQRRTEAVETGQRCLARVDARADNSLRHRLEVLVRYAELWSRNFLELADDYAEGAQRALEAGDIEIADSNWTARLELMIYGGAHLRALEQHAQFKISWTKQWGASSLTYAGPEALRVCDALITGPAPEVGAFAISPPSTNAGESDILEVYNSALLRAVVLAVYGRWAELLELMNEAGPAIERAIPGIWSGCAIHLFTGLAAGALAHDPASPSHERRRLRRQLRRAQRTLAGRVARGGNFAHAELLLRAELASVDGRVIEASGLFAQARARSKDQRNPIYEGLASERAAHNMLRHGLEREALTPLRDARASYQRWGAFAKVKALDATWPELALDTERGSASAADISSVGSSSTTSKALDSLTLLEASQAIAEDIRLNEVIARVLRLAVENAGAQRGALLLASDERLSLAAEYESEIGEAKVLDLPTPLTEIGDRVPAQLLRWVARTAEPIVLERASDEVRFASDPYFAFGDAGSILATPIVKHGALIGLLYLENQLSAGAFTDQRLETLRLLAAQAGSAIDNARLYDDLRTSEVRWRSLVEQLPDHVALVSRERKLDLVNGAQDRDFVVDPDDVRLRAALDRVFETGEPSELELSDGRERHYVLRVAPIAVDDAIERAILVATDVSERRRAALERAQLEDQLRQQQRLESIGTLASGVAHEINNPIQGIMNYSELIASSPGADAEIREFAAEIEHESIRVATIVRSLLTFSRQEREEPVRATPVREIVEDTVSLIRSVLRKDQIQLDLQLDEELPLVSCRSQQIQQVILNLVTNARDATNARLPKFDPRKRIAIHAEAFEREGARWVRLSVQDAGGGVPEEIVERIFDPFFTTKGRDQGTGLGLALSLRIVADHGGELRLDNDPGVGARFCVELRCA